MAVTGGPNTIDDGLVLFVDAKNPDSYNGVSTKWIDLCNGITGTLSTSAMWDEETGSMYVNVNDVNFGHNVLLEPPSITIGAWINLNDRGDRHILLTKWFGWSFEIHADGRPYLRLNGVSPTDLYSSESINWGEWYYITGTFNDTTKNSDVYVNGVHRGNVTRSGSITYNQSGFYIPYIGGTYADGYVAIVQIWNRELTKLEVIENYNSIKGRFN